MLSVRNLYKYQAYGLSIHSSIKLPELITCDRLNPDVVIQFADLSTSPITDRDQYYTYKATTEGMYLYWQEIGTLLIANGSEITIDPIPNVEVSRLRLFILGAAMGTILHQRGYIVLHASAVSIGEDAVVFTADKRRGKSTMAAALHARGHNLIADDVVAIDFTEQEIPIVYPAFPQLKLWPDAVSHLGKSPQDLPQLTSNFAKREYLSKDDFIQQPLILKQIFVLSQSAEIAVKPLSPQEIILYLLRNSYVTRFGSSLLKPNNPSHFLKLSKLAKQTTIERLVRPNDLQLLEKVAQTVEDYLKSKTF